jgi:hypothetical protein
MKRMQRNFITAVFTAAAIAGTVGTFSKFNALQRESDNERTSKQFYLDETRVHAAAVGYLLGQGYKEILTEETNINPAHPNYYASPGNSGGWWDEKARTRGSEFTFRARKLPTDDASVVMVGCFYPQNSTEFSTSDVSCVTRQQPFNFQKDLPSGPRNNR